MKKVIAIISVLIFAIGASVGVFMLVSSKQNQTSVESNPIVSSQDLYESAGAMVFEDAVTTTTSNYNDYVDVATEAIMSAYGDVFENINVVYVETLDTGIHNHIFEIEHTDIIVNVCVDEKGEYSLIGPCNRYGSDYSIVWFEIEPVDRIEVYEYLYEVAGADNYIFDSNQILTNLTTGETYNYGEHAGTAATPEPEQSEPEQSDVESGNAESGQSEFSAG